MRSRAREHLLVAFWTYLLLTELARRVLTADRAWAKRDLDRMHRYNRLQDQYEIHDPGKDADFTERLLAQVRRLAATAEHEPDAIGDAFTRRMFVESIGPLRDALLDYLSEKDATWILIDNLDKGWPIRGADNVDITIVRALLDAVRKIQQNLLGRGIDLHCLVFLRTDIFDAVLRDTPDKGKERPIRLDWDDPAVFKEIVRRRLAAGDDNKAPFEDVWPNIFASHIGTEDSFNYILDRTLMRPRDLLTFLRTAVQVAINRGHTTVTADDILQAERNYSEDLLLTTVFEIQDTHPDIAEVLYAFQGLPVEMTHEEVEFLLLGAGLPEAEFASALELLLWFGFLGVRTAGSTEAQYAYQVQWNLRRLLQPLEHGDASLTLHPAFRAALDHT